MTHNREFWPAMEAVEIVVIERQPQEIDGPAQRVILLFDEFRDSLFRYLRWLGCAPDEADDLLQETFVRLHSHLRAGRPAENLRAWLFRVAGNLVRDERKSGRRRLQEPLEDADGAARGAAAWADPRIGPEQMLLAKESVELLHAAIRRLPRDQRRCLALRSEGFRYREIAEVLGIGVTTVADALRRAVNTLASELRRIEK